MTATRIASIVANTVQEGEARARMPADTACPPVDLDPIAIDRSGEMEAVAENTTTLCA